jgi:hypothetical protein
MQKVSSREITRASDVHQKYLEPYTCSTAANEINKREAQWMRQGMWHYLGDQNEMDLCINGCSFCVTQARKIQAE